MIDNSSLISMLKVDQRLAFLKEDNPEHVKVVVACMFLAELSFAKHSEDWDRDRLEIYLKDPRGYMAGCIDVAEKIYAQFGAEKSISEALEGLELIKSNWLGARH